MRFYLLSIIIALQTAFTFSVYAENIPSKKGTVKGIIIDQDLNEAVGYATVSIIKKTDNSIAGGGLTDDNGKFIIKDVDYGIYDLQVQFVGYTTKNIEVNVNNSTIELGKILIAQNVEQLDEVVVKSQKLNITRSIDKNVVNVSDALIADGNSVTDVLQTVPEVGIGTNGQISLRGESNVRILIDGKPTQIDPSLLFQSLPASSIDKIEIITNPSAKYDPDGLSGIINVITKKNELQGFNGNVNLALGTNEKYTGYLGLNYRFNKFNIFSQTTYSSNKFDNQQSRKRTYDDPTIPSFDQEGESINDGMYATQKIGTDYFLDSTNTITFYYEKWTYQGGTENYFKNNYSLNDVITNTQNERSGNYNESYGNNFSLNHRKEFKKGVLETDLFYGNIDSEMPNYSIIDDAGETTTNNLYDSYWHYFSGKIDYSHTIDEHSSYEVGYRNEYIHADIDLSNTYGGNTEAYNYNYSQMINALYGSYSRTFGNFSMKLGLRAESANINGTLRQDSKADTTYTIDYQSLFPTVHLKQKLNDFQTIGLSYSRRVNRPEILYTVPMVTQSNSSTVTVGNPDLQPSYTNSISMDHNFNKNKLGLNSSIYVRHSTDIVRTVSEYDKEQDVTIYTYDNIGTSITAGASISANYAITDWWSVDANVNLYYLQIQDENEDFKIPDEAKPINWSAKLNTQFTLPKDFSIQVMGRYAGQQYDAQNIMQPTYGLNLAVKKSVLKKKGSVSFKVDDIINSGITNTVYGKGFQEETYFLQERPIYRFSFSYAFGGKYQGRTERKLYGQ